jgi:hypothetical protein
MIPSETNSFLNFLCCCCKKKEKRVQPLPMATPKETQIAITALADRTESPLSSPSIPIELKEINHSRFFSRDVVSLRTALHDDDY